MGYQVILQTRDRENLAVLDHLTSWSYQREVSVASPFAVSIPLTDDNAGLLEAARFVEIYLDSRKLFVGRVADRSVSGGVVQIHGYSEEIVLEDGLVPANYGKALNGRDLAEIARDLCWARSVIRVKDKSEWSAYAIATTHLDPSTEPGLVMISRDGNGRYYSAGSITLRFDSNDVPGFTSWERVRWASDQDEEVGTQVSYRIGGSPTSGAWSTPVIGALTDEIGILIPTSGRYLSVKIDLTTTDTTSDGIGYSPRVYAVEAIARTKQLLIPRFVPTKLDVEPVGLDANGVTNLQVLQVACTQLGYEFSVEDGKLRVTKELSTDRTGDFVFKAGDNIEITSLSDQDTELVNVLTALGPGEGINRMQAVLRDATSIARFGEYPKTKEFNDQATLTELKAEAQKWLDRYKIPDQSYKVVGVFGIDQAGMTGLYGAVEHSGGIITNAAGDPVTYRGGLLATSSSTEPVFQVGDKVQVVDPITRTVAKVRLLVEHRQVTPDSVTLELTLGLPPKSLVDAILDKADPDRHDRLPLASPSNLTARPWSPGIRVSVNPYVGSRAAGVEIHMSDHAGFTPGKSTLVATGQQTTFIIGNLVVNSRYYFQARTYDGRGDFSDFTSEISTIAGGINVELEDGSIGITKFASGIRPVRVGLALPILPDPVNYLIGDQFALYDTIGSLPKLYTALDTDSDQTADTWQPLLQASQIQGLIDGAQIKEHTIVAQNLVVADWSNAIKNPDFADTAVGWNYSATGVSIVTPGAEGLPNTGGALPVRVVKLTQSGNFIQQDAWPASPGEDWYFSLWAFPRGTTPPTGDVGMRVQAYAASGALLDTQLVLPVTQAGVQAWKQYEGQYRTPPLTVQLRITLLLYETTPSGKGWYMGSPVARRAAGGQLIVDGAITAGKIEANTITAAQIKAGAISATELAVDAVTAAKIQAGAVTVDKLAAGSITADKLDLGDTSNIVPNPGFEGPNALQGFDVRGDANITYSGVATKRSGAKGLQALFSSAQTNVAYLGFSGGLADVPTGNPTVQLGDRFFMSVWYREEASQRPGNRPRFYSQHRRADGSYISTCPFVNRSANVNTAGVFAPPKQSNTWELYWAEVTINNPEAVYLWASIMFTTGNADLTRGYIDDLVLRKQNGDHDYGYSSANAGGFSTFNRTEQLQVKQGVITGLPGVPAGADFGFWGTLGAGVFIQGVPKVLGVFLQNERHYHGALVDRTAHEMTSYVNTASFDPISVAEGRKVVALTLLTNFKAWESSPPGRSIHEQTRFVNVNQVAVEADLRSHQGWVGQVVYGPTTISNARFLANSIISAHGGTITGNGTVAMEAFMLLVEVDAGTRTWA